jgi:sulfur carrier protein ThiS
LQVSVKLIGMLLDLLPNGGALGERPRGAVEVDLADGATLPALLEHAGLPADTEYFAMVNDDHVPAEQLATYQLNGGDTVVLCPPLKGG